MKKGKASSVPRILVYYLIVIVIVGLVLYVLNSQFYNKWGEWGKNVLVEAHGFMMDLVIFGFVLTAYELFRQRKDRIERYHEEIDDYRGWDEKEAMYRNAGNIRRLNREGESRIRLYHSNLYNANLIGVNLSGAN